MCLSNAIWVPLLLAAMAGAATPASTEPPVGARSSIKETVKVRLITMDVSVFDRDERTVPGLRAEDFDLFVDGRRVSIDTFDPACAAAALEMPKGGWAGNWTEPNGVGEEPRRVIFVFDYLHLTQVKSTDGTNMMAPFLATRQLARTIRSLPEAHEEIMIVVLDGGLRVEQPFTASRDRTLETLARMEKDVTLYAGFFDHVSEDPLFTGLRALVDLVDSIPGSKAAVIFTGGAGPDDRTYDHQYRALGNHASLARVAFYPVDCSGLNDGGRKAFPFR